MCMYSSILYRCAGLALLAYYAGVFGTQAAASNSNAGLWAAVVVFLGELAALDRTNMNITQMEYI